MGIRFTFRVLINSLRYTVSADREAKVNFKSKKGRVGGIVTLHVFYLGTSLFILNVSKIYIYINL